MTSRPDDITSAIIALQTLEPESTQEGVVESSEITDVLEVRFDEDKNENQIENPKKTTSLNKCNNTKNEASKDDLAASQPQKPIHFRITRHSHNQSPQSQFYSNNNHNEPPQHSNRNGANNASNSFFSSPRAPTSWEEERFRVCIVLVTSWAFLVISILFLVCYGYQLEWSPDTADPIHVFSLELAVNMLYLMFIVDILSTVAVILSHKDHVQPFKLRIFWPAVGFLVLNEIHGTIIWLWVWTGEFPRTCARNSFYLGRRCGNLEMLLVLNPGGNLRLADCKCDYGTCLPECKGLRLIQNYFWGTYWLYIFRLVALVVYIPCLNQSLCQCKWCCCIDPRDRPDVQPSQGALTSDNQHNTEGYAKQDHQSQENHPKSYSSSSRHGYHGEQSQSFKNDSSIEIEIVEDHDETNFDDNGHCNCNCTCANQRQQRDDYHHRLQELEINNTEEPDESEKAGGLIPKRHTIICCDRDIRHHHRYRKDPATRVRSGSPVSVLMHSSRSYGGDRSGSKKNARQCKVIKNVNTFCNNQK